MTYRWDQQVSKEVESPCTSLCKLKHEVCVGCGRTKDEIKKWKGMKHKDKKATVERASVRLKELGKKDKKDRKG
nr:DUF1289 domain-containing protein [Herbaspirillum sp. LeCh32-8]